MTAARHNFVCEQGATFKPIITWAEEDTLVPIDITGYSARMQVRRRASADTIIVSLTDATGSGLTLGGTGGTIAVNITDDTTAAFPTGDFRYDLELESPLGETFRVLEGRFRIKPEVTR